jgi:hypothetical protein
MSGMDRELLNGASREMAAPEAPRADPSFAWPTARSHR